VVTKKKPSAAQIAARKLFAARAKAGTLTKTPKKSRDYARGAEVERSEAALRIAKKVAARKKNPVKKSTSRYVILMGTPGKIIALDLAKANAIKIAKHKFEMTGAHMVVENGDTGEVVYDSAPWYKKNPSPKRDYVEVGFRERVGVYRVLAEKKNGEFEEIARFADKTKAFEYARAFAKQYYRVTSVHNA